MSDPITATTAKSDDESAEPPERQSRDSNLFDALADWLKTKFRPSEDVTLRDILQEVIEEHSDSEALLNPQERLMLMNLAKMRELSVADVMVPRADIIALDVATPFDDVIGMVHIKDVFKVQSEIIRGTAPPKIEALRRDILYVPPSMPVVDLLIKMRATRIHMAMARRC